MTDLGTIIDGPGSAADFHALGSRSRLAAHLRAIAGLLWLAWHNLRGEPDRE